MTQGQLIAEWWEHSADPEASDTAAHAARIDAAIREAKAAVEAERDAARAEVERLRGDAKRDLETKNDEIEETEAAFEDEEAAHADTLRLWELAKADLKAAREECEAIDASHEDEIAAHQVAEARITELEGLLREVEWLNRDNGWIGMCPFCKFEKEDGHAKDCRLAAALPTTPAKE